MINHDIATSPDSSTSGSVGSEAYKTYLRGQNIPVDEEVLQEREIRRQKALELQNAIKQQLEDREKKRKEERELRLKQEREEEERIRRDKEKELERLEIKNHHLFETKISVFQNSKGWRRSSAKCEKRKRQK